MKQVASLRYGVIFKKAFSQPDIFTAFVRDVLDIELEIERVETEKSFPEPIGRVDSRFDLFAEDVKNRIIVDIQHKRFSDHYARFFHYHCAAILEQAISSDDYQPKLKVFTLVVLTSGDKHKRDVAIIDCDAKDLQGTPLQEIPHKVYYLSPKYINQETPARYREWLRAIEDTLDGVVDETTYHDPPILRVFDLIEQNQISPTERARMFDEHGEEELRQQEFQKVRLGIAKAMKVKGFDDGMIAELTGLSQSDITRLEESEIESIDA